MLTRRDLLRGAAVAGAAMALKPLAAQATVITRKPRLELPRHWDTVMIQAPRDGTDVTQTIIEQVMEAPPRTILQFPPGKYRAEGSLRITGKRQLVLRGPAVFYAETPGQLDPQGMSQRRHWWFDACSDIGLEDLRVTSTNLNPDQRAGFGAYVAAYEFEHGFALHGCSNVVIQRCSTKGTWGDGVYVGNTVPSRNITIKDVRVEYNGRQGMAIANAENVSISRAQIMNTRRGGIDLEPSSSSWAIRRVRINDCYLNGYHVAFPAAGRGDVSDVVIQRNEIHGPGVPWVYVAASDGMRRRNWQIRDNVVGNGLGSPVAALRFGRVDDVIVDNNISPIVPTQSRLALDLVETGHVTISGNDFREATTLYRTSGTVGPIQAHDNLLR
jgi:hypothetical protein